MKTSMVITRPDALHKASRGARYAIEFEPGIRIDVPASSDARVLDAGTLGGDRILVGSVEQPIRIRSGKTGTA